MTPKLEHLFTIRAIVYSPQSLVLLLAAATHRSPLTKAFSVVGTKHIVRGKGVTFSPTCASGPPVRFYSFSALLNMPRGVKKEHLPVKICVVCQRPFNWRKKWENVWDEVTTCSKSCNRQRRARNQRERRACQDGDMSVASSSASVTSSAAIESVASVHGIIDDRLPATDVSFQEEDEDGDKDVRLKNEEKALLAMLSSTHLKRDDEHHESMNQSGTDKEEESEENDVPLDPRAARKAAKKAKKAARRAQREGRADPSVGQKQCDICNKSVDLLIRCQIDASGQWRMVCGKCWHIVSGGVVDGSPDHPHYKYGGLWKNRSKR